MRLWTLHPRYLDAKGLVAAWREALLAQKVLEGATKGYTRHPQLHRFRACRRPVYAIAAFLEGLAKEAQERGYHFDTAKIRHPRRRQPLDETEGQLLHEWERLRLKLRARAPEFYRRHRDVARPEAHPFFRIIPGTIRDWESSRSKAGKTGKKCRKTRLFFAPRMNFLRFPRDIQGALMVQHLLNKEQCR